MTNGEGMRVVSGDTNQVKMMNIYRLTNTSDDAVYIGSTASTLKQRLYGHQSASKKKMSKVYVHFRALPEGTKFKIDLIERCPKSECKEREKHWITAYERHSLNERKPMTVCEHGKPGYGYCAICMRERYGCEHSVNGKRCRKCHPELRQKKEPRVCDRGDPKCRCNICIYQKSKCEHGIKKARCITCCKIERDNMVSVFCEHGIKRYACYPCAKAKRLVKT